VIAAQENFVSGFNGILLSEIQEAELQNRIDCKFIFHSSQLDQVLENMKADYRVLEINNIRVQTYDTLYFDDASYNLYLAHHNERSHRYKLRIRHYSSNGRCFAEVKERLNTGRVVKKRLPAERITESFPEVLKNFADGINGSQLQDLSPSARIKFQRLTFVNAAATERITIDINLQVEDDQRRVELPDIIIAEMKKFKKSVSVFGSLMQRMRVKARSVSKYCLAISLLKADVRKNNFKEIHLYLDKLKTPQLNGA
jgi:hypothetical protein